MGDRVSAKTTRTGLATALQAIAPDGWVVLASPPEVTPAPAIVIGPRDPYRVRLTGTQDDLGLRLSLLLPRVAGADAMDVLDDAIDEVRAMLLTTPGVGIASIGGLGTVKEGDVVYLLAAIDITYAFSAEG